MRIKLLTAILSLSLIEAIPAQAGDPCPIQLTVINLGPLGGSKNQIAAEKDEVFKALIKHGLRSECIEIKTMIPKNGYYKLGKMELRAWSLQTLLTDKKRAFRCKDAHNSLAALAAFSGDGTVIYQRGSRRVLLSTAGWQTTCVALSELTGKNANTGLAKLWDGATKKVISDRHANP